MNTTANLQLVFGTDELRERNLLVPSSHDQFILKDDFLLLLHRSNAVIVLDSTQWRAEFFIPPADKLGVDAGILSFYYATMTVPVRGKVFTQGYAHPHLLFQDTAVWLRRRATTLYFSKEHKKWISASEQLVD